MNSQMWCSPEFLKTEPSPIPKNHDIQRANSNLRRHSSVSVGVHRWITQLIHKASKYNSTTAMRNSSLFLLNKLRMSVLQKVSSKVSKVPADTASFPRRLTLSLWSQAYLSILDWLTEPRSHNRDPEKGKSSACISTRTGRQTDNSMCWCT